MMEQTNLPDPTGKPVNPKSSTNSIVNAALGEHSSPTQPIVPGSNSIVNAAAAVSSGAALENAPRQSAESMDDGANQRISSQAEQVAFLETAKRGYILGEDGVKKIPLSDLDHASLWDKLYGNTVDGEHILRRTTGYSFDPLPNKEASGDRHIFEQATGWFPGEKAITYGYAQTTSKVYKDENGNTDTAFNKTSSPSCFSIML